MGKGKVILTLLILVSTMLIVQAEQTVKTLNVPLGYDAVVQANEIKYYNLSVNYPDGISKVLALEVLLTGDFLANSKVYGGFIYNGQTIFCTPNVWTIYRDVDNYDLSFDCTSLLQGVDWKGGNLVFGIMSDKVFGNAKPRVQLTYKNDPKGEATVHGTEYEYDSNSMAKIWLQLIDNTGNDYIEDALCFADIYTPENEQYLEKVTMEYNEDGVYYHDFSVPLNDGVYPVIAECYYNATSVNNNASGNEIYQGVNYANTYVDTWIDDGSYHKINEQKYSGVRRIRTVYNFTGVTTPFANITLGLSVNWVGKWNDQTLNDDITLWIMNWTSGEWIELPNKILAIDGRQEVDNTILAANKDLQTLGYISPTGKVDILFNDTSLADSVNTRLQTDYLSFSTDIAGDGEWQEIKGSSELHIKSPEPYRTSLDSGVLVNDTIGHWMTFNYQVAGTTLDYTETDVDLTLWKPFPCDHVNNVSINYNNGTIQELNYTTRQSDFGRCIITSTIALSYTQNYEVSVKVENAWKDTLYSDNATISMQTDMINISCENYRIANNLSAYQIPMSQWTTFNDSLWSSCQGYLDAYYHYVEVYNKFQPFLDINYNFTNDEMSYLEEQWVHRNNIVVHLNDYANVIMSGLNLGNSYSMALISDPTPPTNPSWATYFSSISSSYLNYGKILSIPSSVWNYEPRNVSVSVNTSGIAQDVWDYNGTINSNLITQFVESFWNWTGSISSVILNSISSDVWNHNSRNLTYINTTEIGDGVWNESQNKYTYGIII